MKILIEVNGVRKMVPYYQYLALVAGGKWENPAECRKGGMIVRIVA